MQIILLAITLASAMVAVLMGTVAWRLIRDERRRSEARIAALSAAINDDEATVVGREPVDAPEGMSDWSLRGEPIALGSDLFGVAHRPGPSRLRFVGIIAAGAVIMLVVGTGLVKAMSAGRGAHRATTAAESRQVASPAAAPAPVPASTALELIALGHEREKDRLTVRGVVRNPAAGTEVRQLNAVVLLFDHDGGFVATGRAPIDGADLAPGAERTFVVSVPAGADVQKYRVSFRSDDHVVPHVDRRS